MSARRPSLTDEIASKVRNLRTARRLTQAELADRIGSSQSRLSEIERGQGSFTAEQFLTILQLFNVPASHFAPARDTAAELQNALARAGAGHLYESSAAIPDDKVEDASGLVSEVLTNVRSPRHVTALAPVLVKNIHRISLHKVLRELLDVGLERRLGWLVDNTLEAVKGERVERLPRDAALLYKRAEVVLGAFLVGLEGRAWNTTDADILDPDIVTVKTLKEVQSTASTISQRWGIVTTLRPEDFVAALKASHGAV